MKIHETLSPLLIIGILSSSTTQSRHPPESALRSRKRFQEKCNKNGGPTAYESAMNVQRHFQHCSRSVLDLTTLKQKLGVGEPGGPEFLAALSQFCQVVPNLEKCVKNSTDTFSLCLEPEEVETTEIIRNVIDSSLEFICYNGGNRLGMSIATGGVECIQRMKLKLAACVNEIWEINIDFFQNAANDVFDISSLVLTREKCLKLDKFRTCFVQVLEWCSYTTPGDVLDALFNTLRKETPCGELIGHPLPPTSTEVSEVPQDYFETECFGNDGLGAYETVMKLPHYYKQCIEFVTDSSDFREDFGIAQRLDILDTVLMKYCSKLPSLENCFRVISDNVIGPCLGPEEKEGLKINDNITSAMLQHVCYDGGDRLNTFFAADGPKCLQTKTAELRVCLNESFSDFFPVGSSASFDLSGHPLVNLSPEKCLKLEKFNNCTVTVLETCPDPTTANAVDGLFKAAIKATPCEELNNYTPRPTPTEVPAIEGQEQGTFESGVTVEELMKQSLVKRIEAAEAQVRASNALEKAARAQKQAARVVEQVTESWLTKNAF